MGMPGRVTLTVKNYLQQRKREAMNRISSSFAKNAAFWSILLLLCNGYTFITHSLIMAQGADKTGFHPLGIVLGFILQAPMLTCLITFQSALDLFLPKLPGRVQDVPKTIATAILIFTFFGFYFSSEETYLRLNLYLGFDTLSILFTDTRQILLNAWHDGAGKIAALACLSLILGVGHTFWNPPESNREAGKLKSRPGGMLPWLGGLCIAAGICLTPFGFFSSSRSVDSAKYHSFPTTYASLTLMQLWFDQSSSFKGRGKPADGHLDRIVSLREYAAHKKSLVDKPNVFIILLEAISSDHVGFNGYFRQDITPCLDELSKDSLVFVNAYAPSNHSNYAQTSIYSSQYPRRKSYLDVFTRVNYPKVTLFDILSFYGYQTAFISSQNENWQGMKRFILTNSHIDYFFHSPNALGENIGLEMKLDDALTRETARRYILGRDKSRPLLLAMNFQRTHFPYNLPEGAQEYYTPAKIDFQFTFFHYPKSRKDIVRNRYDNALRYVDRQVGLFLEFLRKNDLYDNSIIVVAPDHGEAFYEKRYPAHGTSLYEDQVKTFVLFKTVKSRIKGRREGAISLIDINPSVLDLLGLKNHPNFQGRSAINTSVPNNRYIFMTAQGLIPQDAVVDYPWKLIRGIRGEQELLNVIIDPSEGSDLSVRYPQKRKELENALDHYISAQMHYYAWMTKDYYPPKY